MLVLTKRHFRIYVSSAGKYFWKKEWWVPVGRCITGQQAKHWLGMRNSLCWGHNVPSTTHCELVLLRFLCSITSSIYTRYCSSIVNWRKCFDQSNLLSMFPSNKSDKHILSYFIFFFYMDITFLYYSHSWLYYPSFSIIRCRISPKIQVL